MKTIIFILMFSFPVFAFAQKRELKIPQPNVIELTHFTIKLHPDDTMFNNVRFDHLPIKGFPLFTADSRKDFYTIEQRDSVLRKIDAMFFDE